MYSNFLKYGRFWFILLIAFYSFQINALEYYVSPSGNSLEDAQQWVRENNSSMTEDLVVILEGGEYYLGKTFLLTELDGGNNGFKVIYRNKEGEKPILTGGKETGSWEIHDEGKNIWKTTVPSGDKFMQLYLNGEWTIRARIPNKTSDTDFGPYYKTVGSHTGNRTITIDKSLISDWTNFKNVEMVLQPHWYHCRFPLDSYNLNSFGTRAIISFAADSGIGEFFDTKSGYVNGCAFHFENSIDFLDAETEWFLDTLTSTLYFIPPTGEDPNDAKIVYPKVEVLLGIEGTPENAAKNIQITGITFSESYWEGSIYSHSVYTQALDVWKFGSPKPRAAVEISYADSILFSYNTITNTGGSGFNIYKGFKNSRISRNVVNRVSANGIVLDAQYSKNPLPPEACENIVVDNNLIQNMGLQFTNGIGFTMYYPNNVTVEHNEIAYGPYMGVQLGGQAAANENGSHDNKIQYNLIHHVMRLHDDGGGIYNLSWSKGTKIFENWIHDVVKNSTYAMSWPVAAIYLDNYSGYITVENNVSTNVTSKKFERSNGTNNVWTNNNTQDANIMANAGIQELDTGSVEINQGYSKTSNLGKGVSASYHRSNGTVVIKYNIPGKVENTNNIKIDVFNLQGRHLTTLANKKISAGDHKVVWSTANKLGEGVFIVTLRSGTQITRIPIMLY